jgi:flagellar biosynthetic protein FlhB
MSMGEQGAGEKTEDATPKRRADARRKGTVAKSNDLNGALVLFSLALVAPAAVNLMGKGLMGGLRGGIANASMNANPAEFSKVAWTIAQPCLVALALICGVAMTVGMAASFGQVGFVLSGESMTPQLSRLNPLPGLKKFFSVQSSFEGIKAVAKTTIFGLLAYGVLHARWNDLLSLSFVGPTVAASIIGEIAHTILIRVSVAWLAIAAADYFFQRKQIDKQLRMTKDELRREMKEQETSPELRGEMMKRRRQMAKSRPLEAVKDADVTLTNPTHFSVALKYDRSKMHAPMVVAKGQDFLALKIREIAKANGVAIVPNPPLARQLYKQCEVGDFVPRDLFTAVAEVLAYVYQTIKRR